MYKKLYALDLVNKTLIYLTIFFLLTNCSFDKKKESFDPNKKPILEKKSIKVTELNSDLKVKIKNKIERQEFVNQFKNTKIYKFKKIEQIENYQLNIQHLNDGGLIFFDGKGSIFRLDDNLKELWKINFYNKKEIKLNPKLYFNINKNFLIVADSISKIFVVDIDNGNLIWMKESNSPFNSNIIVKDSNFFVLDFKNNLKCFEIRNGNEIWNFQSEDTFIKSQKKLSLILHDEILYFNNNIGDLTAINSNDGSLIWQTPTQDSTIYLNSFSLKISELIFSKNNIYFSNNYGEFFSIDSVSGIINWTQSIKSVFKPINLENIIITFTEDGYMYIIEEVSGNIIRITNIFKNLKNKNKNKLKINDFKFLEGKIIASLNDSNLLAIDIETGSASRMKIKSVSKQSYPSFKNQNLYLLSNNNIIKKYR